MRGTVEETCAHEDLICPDLIFDDSAVALCSSIFFRSLIWPLAIDRCPLTADRRYHRSRTIIRAPSVPRTDPCNSTIAGFGRATVRHSPADCHQLLQTSHDLFRIVSKSRYNRSRLWPGASQPPSTADFELDLQNPALQVQRDGGHTTTAAAGCAAHAELAPNDDDDDDKNAAAAIFLLSTLWRRRASTHILPPTC